MIDVGALLEVVLVSFAGGLLLVGSASLAIRGLVTSRQAGREGRRAASVANLAVGVLAAAVCLGETGLGLALVLGGG